MSLHDLHGETKLPKPTLLRLLATLEAEGYVGQRLSDGLWRYVSRHVSRSPVSDETLVLDHSGPILRDLCKSVMWPSDIAVFDQGSMKVVDTTRSLSPAAFAASPTSPRLPMLNSGLGRAWLAWARDSDKSLSTAGIVGEFDGVSHGRRLAAVRHVTGQCRSLGYGRRVSAFFRHIPRNVSGDIGIARPIQVGDRIVGCVSVMWYLSAMNEAEFVRRNLKPLQEAVDAIGESIALTETRSERSRSEAVTRPL